MKVCICGGGSLGTVCAGVLSSNIDIEVNIYTQRPDKWKHSIIINDINNKNYLGHIKTISNNLELASRDCDIILLCLPGFLIEKTLYSIKDILKEKTIVGSIVSNTGFFFQAHNILPSNTPLFGFQRVPYIARTTEYGHKAKLLGYKSQLAVALENIENTEEFRLLLENFFMTPTKVLNNFYEASLSNSNPILHTGRLYSMWHDWDGKPYPECSYFYKEWTEDASKTIIEMDNEFMLLLETLSIDKSQIPSLLEYYESKDSTSLTLKLSSIPAFQAILSPMKEVKGGWVPDFCSRYFKEDFPHGLKYIKELALKHQIPTPTIDKVFQWGIEILQNYE